MTITTVGYDSSPKTLLGKVVPAIHNNQNTLAKGSLQKLLSGFFSAEGDRYPPIPLSFFGQNDFPLRGGLRKNPLKRLFLAQNANFSPF